MTQSPNNQGLISAFLQKKVQVNETALSIAVAALSLIVTLSGFFTHHYSNLGLQLLHKSVRFEILNGEIQKFDEVLTMSAKMAAATGQQVWEDRYNQYDPMLGKALEDLNKEFPEFNAGAITENANAELVRLERESFELVKKGNNQQAQLTLESEKYLAQKLIYVKGMQEAKRELNENYEKQLSQATNAKIYFQTALFLFLVITLAAVFMLFRKVKKQNAELIEIGENLEERVKIKSQQLAQASKLASLGEMSAGVAHEINNPLAVISFSTQALLRDQSDPEKVNKKLTTILKTTQRISKIVAGLKKFSRSDQVPEYTTLPLKDVVVEAISLIEHKSKQELTPLTIDIRTEALIFGNQVEIEQVIINLVGNAIDAAKEGSDPWVQVVVFDEQNEAVIQIIDSGPGIPQAALEKIFDPFFTTKGVGKGTGLGLSISKGILDSHNAQLRVLKDRPNTCFEIRFSISK